MRAGEGAGDGPPGGGGLGGSPCSNRKASRSTYSTSPNGSVRSHSSGASRLGPGAVAGRPRGDPPPTAAPGGASAGPAAVSRPGPGTVAAGRAALRSFSFKRPGGQGRTRQGGEGEECKEETPIRDKRKGGMQIQRKRRRTGETGERGPRERTETGRNRQRKGDGDPEGHRNSEGRTGTQRCRDRWGQRPVKGHRHRRGTEVQTEVRWRVGQVREKK